MQSTPVLEVRQLAKRFGEFVALQNVDLTVMPGAVQALIGPNGAGKTTLVNVVTGVHQASAGSVKLASRDITRMRPFEIARMGLGRTFQITSLFLDLTVRENIEIALVARGKYAADRVAQERHAPADAGEIMALLGLEPVAGKKVHSISHGDQRLVELGVTLATDPLLVLMDEPTAGMSPSETEAFIRLVNDRLRGRHTILLIEHDMNVVMKTADRITVLAAGATLAEGTASSIMENTLVKEAYLGRAAH